MSQLSFMHQSRSSDSQWVENVWEVICYADGDFLMCADASWDLIIAYMKEGIHVYVNGPGSKATHLSYTSGTRLLGIRFAPGMMLHDIRFSMITNDFFLLAHPSSRMFWLSGYAYELPTFENAEDFVGKLYDNGLLLADRVIQMILRKNEMITSRALQRHFLYTTGLTQMEVRQIQRAWQAMRLLQDGKKTAIVAAELGYTDQTHMTRFLKRLLGQTPKHIDQIVHS